MTDAAPAPPVGRPLASTGVFLGTFAAILGLIVALLVLDLALARIDREERRRQAANAFVEGRALLAAGRPGDAADRLATATTLERDNVGYGLALAQALLANGKAADAEEILNRLLDRARNDGAVNLTMARLLASTARKSDAKAFYHRAIYGRWGSDSIARRTAARFELIDLLARQRAHEELLAELLPLQSAPADSAALLARLGPLYLRADSPSRAAEAYRALLRRSPSNADAYAGLGEADLALGQFQAGRAAFRSAVRARPSDSSIVRRLRVIDSVLALDPTGRGLSDAERLTRSRALLERTLVALDACAAADTVAADVAVLDSARAERAAPKPRGDLTAVTERKLSLAETLWRMRPADCVLPTGEQSDILELLQRSISR
jgi:tetratricopeptide (TPR) repeat protein